LSVLPTWKTQETSAAPGSLMGTPVLLLVENVRQAGLVARKVFNG
jgi:hypothetical protein